MILFFDAGPRALERPHRAVVERCASERRAGVARLAAPLEESVERQLPRRLRSIHFQSAFTSIGLAKTGAPRGARSGADVAMT